MSKNQNKLFMEEMMKSIKKESVKETKSVSDDRKSNTFDRSLKITQEIMSGNRIKTPRYLVDTSVCRLWENHNRAYSLLNEHRCSDLIDQFKETGKQEFPAIVREIEGQGDHRYEVICGARRLWVAKYLGWKYLVEVRNLSDEEAFRLSDIENRAREDISDYERALDYKNALDRYYNNQTQMAKRLEVSASWLSRYLQLAELPKEIVSSYRDIIEIKELHARGLAKYLKQKEIRGLLIEHAIEIQPLKYEGAKVFAELKNAVEEKKQTRMTCVDKSTTDDGLAAVSFMKNKKTGDIELKITSRRGASKKKIKELVLELFDTNY